MEKGIDSWGGFFWEKDDELRRALVALLVDRGGEKLKSPEALAPTVRLWLADYYQSRKDERCLQLIASIVNEVKKPVHVSNPLLFQAMERASWFYAGERKYDKVAHNWDELHDFYDTDTWDAEEASLNAAISYSWTDQKGNYQSSLLRLSKSNEVSVAIVASIKLSRLLYSSGKFQECKMVLIQCMDKALPRPLRLLIISELCDVLYQMKDYGESDRYATLGLSEIGDGSSEEDFVNKGSLIESLRSVSKFSRAWRKSPFFVAESHVSINISSAYKGDVERRINILSPNSSDLDFQISAKEDWIKVESCLVTQDDLTKNYIFSIIVTTPRESNSAAKGNKGLLVIKCKQQPNFSIELPVDYNIIEQKVKLEEVMPIAKM